MKIQITVQLATCSAWSFSCIDYGRADICRKTNISICEDHGILTLSNAFTLFGTRHDYQVDMQLNTDILVFLKCSQVFKGIIIFVGLQQEVISIYEVLIGDLLRGIPNVQKRQLKWKWQKLLPALDWSLCFCCWWWLCSLSAWIHLYTVCMLSLPSLSRRLLSPGSVHFEGHVYFSSISRVPSFISNT